MRPRSSRASSTVFMPGANSAKWSLPKYGLPGARGDHQAVVGQRRRGALAGERERAGVGVHVQHVPEQDARVRLTAQDLAGGGGDLALGQDAGGDLVQQRLEQVVDGPADQRDVDVGVRELLDGEEAAEAGAHDDDVVAGVRGGAWGAGVHAVSFPSRGRCPGRCGGGRERRCSGGACEAAHNLLRRGWRVTSGSLRRSCGVSVLAEHRGGAIPRRGPDQPAAASAGADLSSGQPSPGSLAATDSRTRSSPAYTPSARGQCVTRSVNPIARARSWARRKPSSRAQRVVAGVDAQVSADGVRTTALRLEGLGEGPVRPLHAGPPVLDGARRAAGRWSPSRRRSGRPAASPRAVGGDDERAAAACSGHRGSSGRRRPRRTRRARWSTAAAGAGRAARRTPRSVPSCATAAAAAPRGPWRPPPPRRSRRPGRTSRR
jgi:hypothetical protein